MARTRRDEERFLTKDESEVVARTHLPAVKMLSDAELGETIRALRERRDRARDIAKRQRREMRGKAAPSGAKPAAGNEGTRYKGELLAAAMKRVNKEQERRRSAAAAQ